jgi:hypothetical protein
LRQAYDYWQDQPGNYPIHSECLHVDLSSQKSEALEVLMCTKLLNESRALFRVSQPSVGLDFYQNESWNDECNNESLHRLVYQSRLSSFPGYTPTIIIAPDSGVRNQSVAFSSVANAHSDSGSIIDGDATFFARCVSMANLKPLKARRRKTYALTNWCKYYSALPSGTNTPVL